MTLFFRMFNVSLPLDSTSHIRPSILSCTQRETLTWSCWPTASSASAALHGMLGPCSSCVPIREPWLMWPVLAFHLGSPAPHLAPAVWWSAANCHRLWLLGQDCPPIPLIDSWSSHSAQVSPHRISLDLTRNMEWNIILTSQAFPSFGGVKRSRPRANCKDAKERSDGGYLWTLQRFWKPVFVHSKDVGSWWQNYVHNAYWQRKSSWKFHFKVR